METRSQAASLHKRQDQQGGRTVEPWPAPQVYYGVLPPPWLWGLPYWAVPAAVPQAPAQAHSAAPAAVPQTHRAVPAAPPQAPAQGSAHATQPPTDESTVPTLGRTLATAGTSPQAGAAIPPARPVQQMAPVRLVPGVAPVTYPVLPAGTRNRRYWF